MDSETRSLWWEVSSKAALTFPFILLAGLWYYSRINGNRKKGQLPLPPGPQGLPIVGSLPFIERNVHSYFAKLSQTYGPIIKIQLGSKTCIVASSPSTAKEILKDQDATFANRDAPIATKALTYGIEDLVFSGSGPTWRTQRKLVGRDLMGKKSLDALCKLRECEVRKTIGYVNSKAGKPINIAEQMFRTMFNLVMNMLLGGTVKGQELDDVGAEFLKVVLEFEDALAKPNISDFFPILARFDLQGIERQTKRVLVLLDQIYDSIIGQRMRMDKEGTEEQGQNKQGSDFLQILLQLKDEDPKTPLTLNHVKVMLFELEVAATGSSSATVEWAMTEVIRHPEIMRNLQKELEEVVGRDNVVEESHLPKLHYLNAVLKEVFRLHPVAPLLLTRRSIESCVASGYTIPNDSLIFVNVWAIHRDPTLWENPLEFRPERFYNITNEKWDYSGNDHRYMPFGSGRRI